jgi:hypothetical protein
MVSWWGALKCVVTCLDTCITIKYAYCTTKSKTVIFPVVLYRSKTWSLTLREEHRLRVSEKMLLRKVVGPKREVTGGCRRLHYNITAPHLIFYWGGRIVTSRGCVSGRTWVIPGLTWWRMAAGCGKPELWYGQDRWIIDGDKGIKGQSVGSLFERLCNWIHFYVGSQILVVTHNSP